MSKTKGAEIPLENIQNLPFEEALKRLESIVESMEAQDVPLEKLLGFYEEGMALTQRCMLKLSEAELKIQQLEKSSKGELMLKPVQIQEERL